MKIATSLLLLASSLNHIRAIKAETKYGHRGVLHPQPIKISTFPSTTNIRAFVNNVRGGGIKKKGQTQPTLQPNKVSVLGPIRTTVDIQSSVVQCSKTTDVLDVQYKKALIKTALTVFSAGETSNALIQKLKLIKCILVCSHLLLHPFALMKNINSRVWCNPHGNKRDQFRI